MADSITIARAFNAWVEQAFDAENADIRGRRRITPLRALAYTIIVLGMTVGLLVGAQLPHFFTRAPEASIAVAVSLGAVFLWAIWHVSRNDEKAFYDARAHATGIRARVAEQLGLTPAPADVEIDVSHWRRRGLVQTKALLNAGPSYVVRCAGCLAIMRAANFGGDAQPCLVAAVAVEDFRLPEWHLESAWPWSRFEPPGFSPNGKTEHELSRPLAEVGYRAYGEGASAGAWMGPAVEAWLLAAAGGRAQPPRVDFGGNRVMLALPFPSTFQEGDYYIAPFEAQMIAREIAAPILRAMQFAEALDADLSSARAA